jgi:hypothetical protein
VTAAVVCVVSTACPFAVTRIVTGRVAAARDEWVPEIVYALPVQPEDPAAG